MAFPQHFKHRGSLTILEGPSTTKNSADTGTSSVPHTSQFLGDVDCLSRKSRSSVIIAAWDLFSSYPDSCVLFNCTLRVVNHFANFRIVVAILSRSLGP